MATNQVLDCTLEKLKDISKPCTILLFSGKRKSGKDYITNILHERIGYGNSAIVKLSGPIKLHWAKSKNLNLDELLSDGKYKEQYRHEMAKWGEAVRREDYGYFCRAAINIFPVAYNKPIWIVSDARRKTDVQWFMNNFRDICKTVRIESDDLTRINRGWIFSAGIDDAETECDLDDFHNWDLVITNNGIDINAIMDQILELINQ